jgi:hypothetical protein
MLTNVFAIYDSKVEAFLQPFFSPTKGSAIRAVSEEVNNPQAQLAKHAEDFTLFHLGTFDDSNGALDKLAAPASVSLLIELKSAA